MKLRVSVLVPLWAQVAPPPVVVVLVATIALMESLVKALVPAALAVRTSAAHRR